MGKSKKRLIDADLLKQAIEELSHNPPICTVWTDSNTYSSDPIAQAVNQKFQELESQINNAINSSFTTTLMIISQKIDEATYQDHPCLLCREDEDMKSPVEDFGDIRLPKKVANL